MRRKGKTRRSAVEGNDSGKESMTRTVLIVVHYTPPERVIAIHHLEHRGRRRSSEGKSATVPGEKWSRDLLKIMISSGSDGRQESNAEKCRVRLYHITSIIQCLWLSFFAVEDCESILMGDRTDCLPSTRLHSVV